MDNITHSLFGCVIAEAVVDWHKRREKSRSIPRRTFWLVSIVANNIPDIDFVYANLLTPGKLGYLLHHRGHSHTLVAALILGVAVFVVAAGIHRLAHTSLLPNDKWLLLLLSVWGISFHVGLDALNSYGVHPFWPVDNHWYYGDSVFIVEPWLWVSLLPVLLKTPNSRLYRALFGLLLAASLALCWLTKLVPWQGALVVTLWGAALLFMTPLWIHFNSQIALCASLVVVFIYTAISRHVRYSYEHAHRSSFPQEVLVDAAISSLPANPFCWSLMTLSKGKNSVVLRRGFIGPFPRWFAPDRCPRFRGGSTTVAFRPVTAGTPSFIDWIGEVELSTEPWKRLRHEHCGVRAFLRFARVPFIVHGPDELIVGDLRFDWNQALGFAEILYPNIPPKCPTAVPPWVEPTNALWELDG